MKVTKIKTACFIAFIGALFFVVGPLILPINRGVRFLSFFLYFYVCVEMMFQIYIAHKRNKEIDLQNEQKTKKQ